MKYLMLLLFMMSCAVARAAEPVTVSTTKITSSLYLLQGAGGNVMASVGSDGVLLIDDDYSQNAPIFEAAIDKLTESATRFVINTHWHGDHTGGNEYWGKSGAVIVAHDNVRERLSTVQVNKFFGRETPASDPAAWPLVSYGTSMAMHVNGDTLELQHYPRGHTDGDTVVYFTRANVVHMGDHYFKDRFPFVDLASGGNAVSFADNIAAVLQKVDSKTVIVPGHGALADKADLQRYHAMLVETQAEVRAMKSSGMTLKQVQARGLDDQWQSWGGGFINQDNWIVFLYTSMD